MVNAQATPTGRDRAWQQEVITSAMEIYHAHAYEAIYTEVYCNTSLVESKTMQFKYPQTHKINRGTFISLFINHNLVKGLM